MLPILVFSLDRLQISLAKGPSLQELVYNNSGSGPVALLSGDAMDHKTMAAAEPG